MVAFQGIPDQGNGSPLGGAQAQHLAPGPGTPLTELPRVIMITPPDQVWCTDIPLYPPDHGLRLSLYVDGWLRHQLNPSA